MIGGIFIAIAASVPFAASAEGSGSDDEFDEPMFERCVNVRAIRSTDVVNDNTIVFRMVGNKYYANVMPQTCRGLSRDGRFSYQIYERRLCKGDRIRILLDSGANMIEGRACQLGEFRRLSVDEVEDVFSPGPRTIEPEPVPPADVEEIDVTDDDEDDEDRN